MKKLQVVVLAIFSTFILTSCTDDTEYLLEKEDKANVQESQIGFIDKDEVESPDDRK
ncbi:hypothetical protein [Tenacibaculum finnmarkense]|uniref:hypothetical protein n=1 Tax=Tenacibaculum finnmarkense TaxID=2781243 RepID=UPI00187B4B1A|nr:hypothetical protein [Tenacibaculum finnmarkense]MDB0614027.1 hypothetical protein [Tenacibaculum dicentrarchi]MBE7693544.1 hypothetical protein [Tenacibaculum finnmarkense genomovar finnmarkense]MCG8239576.1 hypothetical protein [Tenacibaculum finnmarkense genomovar ulcerans]MCG8806255.1 hypothetical protein [Tenacibaculum finnmarkense]MCG8857394.1 hypothetical protein [Tenacibaculum finnmarkense]